MNKQALQKLLKDATSNKNWNVSNTLKQQIADAISSPELFGMTFKHIWEKLNSKGKDYNRILKSLILIEYLLVNGPPDAIEEVRANLFKIKTLESFTHNENKIDKAPAIRLSAAKICQLISDPDTLSAERKNAYQIHHKLKNRITAISSSNYQPQSQNIQPQIPQPAQHNSRKENEPNFAQMFGNISSQNSNTNNKFQTFLAEENSRTNTFLNKFGGEDQKFPQSKKNYESSSEAQHYHQKKIAKLKDLGYYTNTFFNDQDTPNLQNQSFNPPQNIKKQEKQESAYVIPKSEDFDSLFNLDPKIAKPAPVKEDKVYDFGFPTNKIPPPSSNNYQTNNDGFWNQDLFGAEWASVHPSKNTSQNIVPQNNSQTNSNNEENSIFSFLE